MVASHNAAANAAALAGVPVTLTLTVTNAGNVKVSGLTVTSAVGLTCDGAADGVFDLAYGTSRQCRYLVRIVAGQHETACLENCPGVLSTPCFVRLRNLCNDHAQLLSSRDF